MSASFLVKPPRSMNCRAAMGSRRSTGGVCGSMPRSMLAQCSRQCFSRRPSVKAVARQLENTLTALSVEGLPGAPLLVLGEGEAVVVVVVPLIAHVAQPRDGPALEILREETVGPPDGGIRMVVRSEGAGARVHPDLVPDRPVDE